MSDGGADSEIGQDLIQHKVHSCDFIQNEWFSDNLICNIFYANIQNFLFSFRKWQLGPIAITGIIDVVIWLYMYIKPSKWKSILSEYPVQTSV